MNDKLQVWANIAQILSLPVAVIALLLQLASYANLQLSPILALTLRRLRPILPYIIIGALCFWFGGYLVGTNNVPNDGRSRELQATSSAAQTTIATLQKQTPVAAIPPVVAVTQNAVTQAAITQVVTQIGVTQIIATSPPSPTSEPVIVVATPTIPPATPEPENTPEGTILDDGGTWKMDNARLTLKSKPIPDGSGMYVDVSFKNNSDAQMSVAYSGDNFSAVDSNGKNLQVFGFNECGSIKIILDPGKETANTNCPYVNYGIRIPVDLNNPQIKYVIVAVTDIWRIKKAQWKIPLNFR